MGRSVFVEPPKGSELAARYVAIKANQSRADCLRELGASYSDEILIETGELLALEHDPRIWKHPTNLIARHYLPFYLAQKYGAEAADCLAENSALAMSYAQDLQRLEFLEATAAERSKEPTVDPGDSAKVLVFAEFLNVQNEYPGASLNYCFEKTAERLGGAGAPLNRASVRRAVAYVVSMVNSQTKEGRDLQIRAITHFQEFFRPGWRKRLEAS